MEVEFLLVGLMSICCVRFVEGFWSMIRASLKSFGIAAIAFSSAGVARWGLLRGILLEPFSRRFIN